MTQLDKDTLNELIEVLGEDLQLVVGEFTSNLPSQVATIGRQIGGQDLNGIAATAHVIKGSAANLGARQLAGIASRIETAAREGRLDTASQAFTELAASADDTIAEYRSLGLCPSMG